MTKPQYPLSPATQNVWQKFCGIVEDHGPPRLGLAAALRALADQVVPQPRIPYDSCCDVHAAAIRAEIHAIAAELECNHD